MPLGMQDDMSREGMSRKKFLEVVGIASGACSLPIGVAKLFTSRRAHTASRSGQKIQIRPLAGHLYSPAFVAFCERARFDSVEHALRSMTNRTLEFSLKFVDA